MSKNAKSAKPAKPAKPAKSNGEFISEDAISTGAASYMKLEKGTNQFRIISEAVAGWLEWIDKKPMRTSLADGEPEASDDENPPKKFVAMVVIDRKDGNVKILELTQQSVIKGIRALTNNPDWGMPYAYDINVEKTGDGMKTKYTISPSPKKALSKEAIKAAQEKPCNLEALFNEADPWDTNDADELTEYHLTAK